MQGYREERKHMAEITQEYSGLHTVSCSLIQLFILLYIALCIPQIVKVFWIVYINKNLTCKVHSFHFLPFPYLNKNVVNYFRGRLIFVPANQATSSFCAESLELT